MKNRGVKKQLILVDAGSTNMRHQIVLLHMDDYSTKEKEWKRINADSVRMIFRHILREII